MRVIIFMGRLAYITNIVIIYKSHTLLKIIKLFIHSYLKMYQDFECPHLNFLIFWSSFIEERGTQTDPLLVQDPQYPDAHHQHHHQHGVQQDLSRTTIQNQSGASLANVVSPPNYPPPGQVARKKVTHPIIRSQSIMVRASAL